MGDRLRGQVALVTGGGRGIGRAIAERFAAEGAAVTVVARTARQLAEVVVTVEQAGGRAHAVTCDVTNRADVTRAVAATEERFGPITLLVNSAGQAGPFGPIGTVDPDEWWFAQSVHVRGPLLFMSAVLPGMTARRAGRILNICSVGGLLTTPALSAYGVGKCAEIRLTEHVDLEAQEHGVRAFAIQPGTIVTELAQSTMSSPDAQRWVPGMIDLLGKITEEESARSMRRCADLAVQIAAGKYDLLAGRYIDFDSDLDALAAEVAAGKAPGPNIRRHDR